MAATRSTRRCPVAVATTRMISMPSSGVRANPVSVPALPYRQPTSDGTKGQTAPR